MITYAFVAIAGMAVGAFVLDRTIRLKYNKSYAKWIKDDFALQWRLIKDLTLTHHYPGFSDSIQRISPQFCSIYGEASVAEQVPLSAIAGIGYGKALEFLVKDYAKHENPSRAAEIEHAPLAVCVREYLRDKLVRDCAELATWLRNDEAHYVRKYEQNGLPELKHLIALVVRLIDESERRRVFAAEAEGIRSAMKREKEGDSIDDRGHR